MKPKIFWAMALAVAIPQILPADELRYEAVWHAGSGSNIVTEAETLPEFRATGEAQTANGLRLIDVETTLVDGTRLYSGLWVGGTGSNLFDGPLGAVALRERIEEREAQGLRMVDFELFRAPNGGRRYLAVWRPGQGDQRLTGPMEQDAFLARGQRLVEDEGFRLIDVEVERRDGVLLYSGLFRSGRGSNLITTPLRRAAFIERREEMRAQGLELVDFETIRAGGARRFIGVWASGDGEGKLTLPRNFDQFVEVGVANTQDGFRTEDMELRVRVTSEPSVPEPVEPVPPGPGPTTADLPDNPLHIDLVSGNIMTVDFTLLEGLVQIELPLDHLPDFLPEKDGEVVLPDNICGFSIRMAQSFSWQIPGDDAFDNAVFNSVPDVASLGSDALLGGINFFGPTGVCAEEDADWNFPLPFTTDAIFEPLPNMRLVIQLMPGGEIRFTEHSPPDAEHVLDAHELFRDETSEKLKKIAEFFEFHQEIDNGYCGIDRYVKKICMEEEDGKAPIGSCPVSDDFSSPC